MRKGFDGLCGVVWQHLDKDLLRGDVFVFLNKRRSH
ncbi:MAG: IS66 family insertion sequence element accessory protein TnpB [Bacteroidia bacterium]|nr:IS66 family insertion sequence element accessory protein TnpB [Bacteroidia bacterium]